MLAPKYPLCESGRTLPIHPLQPPGGVTSIEPGPKPACRLKSLLRTPDQITQESHWISTKTEALSYFAFGASVLEV